jgi:hypothetical protein
MNVRRGGAHQPGADPSVAGPSAGSRARPKALKQRRDYRHGRGDDQALGAVRAYRRDLRARQPRRRGVGRVALNAPPSWRPSGRSRAPSSAACPTAARGSGGRTWCCSPPIPQCRWRSRSSCPSRAPAGWRRSAARGCAAGSSVRAATTHRRMWRVRFPVPFPRSTPTTPFVSCPWRKP